MQKNILLINPDMYSHYKSKIKVAVNPLPSLTAATLAAPLLEHNIKIVDMAVSPDCESLRTEIKKLNSDYICITSLTPTFDEAKRIIQQARQCSEAMIILGGAHVSSAPEKCLEESNADIIVKGEGDLALKQIIQEGNLTKIKGITYRKGDKIIRNPDRDYIKNLDILPYPAWHLFNIKKYKCSRLIAKKSLVGPIETSRGCVSECIYCNKNIFGRTFRAKSPKRVVEEIKFMLNSGFEEIAIYDDGLSTQLERGKKICKLIIKEKLSFPWTLTNGIRVDRVDEELVNLLKKSGCYRIAYGIESGNQEILNRTKKGITLSQVRKAVALTKKYGLETQGFFMLGLPGETEKTMQQTIDFAKSLDLDTYKVAITMPLPGTPLYDELNKGGFITFKDWSKLSQHTQEEAYKHPNLDWKTIMGYYSRFYKETMFNPPFIFKRIKKGLTTGQAFWDAYYFIKSFRTHF